MMHKERRYAIYDVFTDEPLEGNPLALVLDAEGLSHDRMQAIAREFNLSETAFLLPPEHGRHSARVRIFTPHFEMPFAGHPTVGSAIAIADEQGISGAGEAAILVLEENIGPVRCAVKQDQGRRFAEFDLPQLPEPLDLAAEPAAIGAALGLDPQDIGFENHQAAVWSTGVPYVTVPVRGLEAAGRIRFDQQLWAPISPLRDNGVPASVYVYCRETYAGECHFHARMFVGGSPSYEDPATGSAAAAFAGQVVACDAPRDGSHSVWIEQGVEMGRPSRIRLELEIHAGKIEQARIGGYAVRIAEGRLLA